MARVVGPPRPRGSALALHMAVRDLARSVFLCDMDVFDATCHGGATCRTSSSGRRAGALRPAPAPCLSRGAISSEAVQAAWRARPFSLAQEACRPTATWCLGEVRFFNLQVLLPAAQRTQHSTCASCTWCATRAVLRSREQTAKALARDNGIVRQHPTAGGG